MAKKRKEKASHGLQARKAAAKRNATASDKRSGGDTIQRAGGRAAHEDVVRRGDLDVSEAWRDRALQERDKSRAQASDAKLKSRDAAKAISAGLSRPSKCCSPLDTTIIFHVFFHLRKRGAGSAQEVPNGPEEGNRM